MLSQFAFLIMYFIGSGNRNIYYCQSGKMDVTFSKGKFGSLSNFRTLLVLAFSLAVEKIRHLLLQKTYFCCAKFGQRELGDVLNGRIYSTFKNAIHSLHLQRTFFHSLSLQAISFFISSKFYFRNVISYN